MTAMVYHFLAPGGERNISLNQLSNCKVLLLTKSTKAVRCFKNAANIFLSNIYDFFPVVLLLTNHKTLYNINIHA